ncbi:SDR family oxidoreductase [Tranquillimonas alkanivorans]|uniref:Putative NADH-flavin reductase n=1 Tax=Tranquillimonas alkanivorans TaxID=441119 RepID=A0A1I5MZI1_9RHOB|nr:SDR family oxidoreductase [Tranquillimonas alkanivorans]SFP14973.1 Putative NADH-flavin reductase [Tranquillimonas alkanivorans]
MKLAVIGASGTTGQQIVNQAVAAGHDVRAIDRDDCKDAAFPNMVDRRQGDVLEGDLAPLLEGREAVLSGLGVPLAPKTAASPPPLYSEGTRNIVDAMRRAGVRRLVVISATFVATRDRGPLWFRAAAHLALDRIFDQMAEMEEILRGTDDIDWTAVRPGWLLDGALTRDYVVRPDAIPDDLIRTRHADLAHFMLHCAESDDWVRQTPAVARAEEPAVSGPQAVLQELAG